MNRRVIRPYKVLAVALGAGASMACTTAPRPDPPASAAASSATAAATQAGAQAAAAPLDASARLTPPDDKADPKLLALRDELDRASNAEIVAKEEHFRPLCDKDGYPLVGNVIRKAPQGSSPSSFCATQRTKKPS